MQISHTQIPAPDDAREGVYAGLMSGTSMDGVDGVLARFPSGGAAELLAHVHLPFPAALRTAAFALQHPGENELERVALLGNALAELYAQAVHQLRAQVGGPVCAVGMHGQTLRHRPERGYTWQAGNGARLAELCGLDVIADFRSRDVAAAGQGAPLVPAFHRALFAAPGRCRVVVNLGGMANLTILHADGSTQGFDTGPGNVLLDAWSQHVRALPYDAGGAWAASGRVLPALLETLLAEPFFRQPPPKSTGRDLFDWPWLQAQLAGFLDLPPADVQATLAALTASSVAQAIAQSAPQCTEVFVCGGGVGNTHVLTILADCLRAASVAATVHSTAQLGVDPQWVEALAFAWLARQHRLGHAGNVPEVTGAHGLRVLGACYPA